MRKYEWNVRSGRGLTTLLRRLRGTVYRRPVAADQPSYNNEDILSEEVADKIVRYYMDKNKKV